VETTHCYAVVACEGRADELCKTSHSCRARLFPCCADPLASASSSAKVSANALLNWDATGEALGISFGSAGMSNSNLSVVLSLKISRLSKQIQCTEITVLCCTIITANQV